MQKAKLLKLADFLEVVPIKKFEMKEFRTGAYCDKDNCFTTACACGWATVCFPRSGLKPCDYRNIVYTNKAKETFYGWYAVEQFFGLNEQQAYHLFREESYPEFQNKRKVTPKMVAKRIRKFVNEN